MAIEHVRLSQKAKDQLIKLKRVTGIKHWNILCRWALCMSLAEPSVPPQSRILTNSNVDMNWKVFGGRYADLYFVLVKERCIQDGLGTDPETVAQQFRLHLHRGISYLAGNKEVRKIDNLIALVA